MKWWHISTMLCAYGFFKEFRPSEPFISPYLTSHKNFTIEQVNRDIYPVGTYVHLSLVVLMFLVTDYIRYKPVLVAGSLSAVVTWCMLIWSTTVQEMQVVEFFYGFFMASEVAYYTYIYAKVDKKHYQKVTSHTRAAYLLGKATSGVASQLLISIKVDYLQLNYFSVFGVGITVPIAFCLPSVSQSIYFHNKALNEISAGQKADCYNLKEVEKCKKDRISSECLTAFRNLNKDFRLAFMNWYILKWSIWWALVSAAYFQATSYIQLLWEEIVKGTDTVLYHGYIEFIFAVSGATVAFGVGYLKISWRIWGELFLAVFTISQGALLFYNTYLTNLYISYVIFVLYRNFYEAAITVATYEVAKHISKDSYALVFGVNTFAALIFQAIITAVVIGSMNIDTRNQFRIYGAYLFVIGVGFLTYGVIKLLFFRKKM